MERDRACISRSECPLERADTAVAGRYNCSGQIQKYFSPLERADTKILACDTMYLPATAPPLPPPLSSRRHTLHSAKSSNNEWQRRGSSLDHPDFTVCTPSLAHSSRILVDCMLFACSSWSFDRCHANELLLTKTMMLWAAEDTSTAGAPF